MPISSEAFREALRHFPSGVTIVTIRAGDAVHGLTVSAFASVSPEPPLVMVAIDHQHSAFHLLQHPDAVFAINILHQDQMELSNRFAWLKDEDRFLAGDWRTAETGAPILADALAWLDCTIYARYEAGTHHIYIGEVQASAAPRPGDAPLVYWNRGYRALALRPHDATEEE
ncbi:MAG: flavin reductase family protein [Anaerolineae bacterium]|nr:flavin reductase family protein [Anaerolineae bacterium]